MKNANFNAVIFILSLVVLAVGTLMLASDSFADPALDEKTAGLIHVNTKAPAAATICQRLWNEDGFIKCWNKGE
jgi:hypothetical protein